MKASVAGILACTSTPSLRTLCSWDRIWICWILLGLSSFRTISCGYLQNLHAGAGTICHGPCAHPRLAHTNKAHGRWHLQLGLVCSSKSGTHPIIHNISDSL